MEKIKLIGERIKTLREISGKTADETAKLLNVPKETYLKYEKGRADIPVSFIFDAARAFNTELTAILTGDTPKLHKYCVVRKGTAPFAGRKKEYIYGDLAYNFAGKKMEVFEVTAGGKMPKDSNIHAGQEFNYVLEGVLKIRIDNDEITLKKGDSVYFDSGRPHFMSAAGGKKARFLAVIV